MSIDWLLIESAVLVLLFFALVAFIAARIEKLSSIFIEEGGTVVSSKRMTFVLSILVTLTLVVYATLKLAAGISEIPATLLALDLSLGGIVAAPEIVSRISGIFGAKKDEAVK